MEEYRNLLNKQKETLDLKSKVEAEKSEISLKMSEVLLKNDSLEQLLKIKNSEIELLNHEILKSKDSQSLMIEKEIEHWKTKLISIEKTHQEDLKHLKDNINMSSSLKDELQGKIQSLEKELSEVIYTLSIL